MNRRARVTPLKGEPVPRRTDAGVEPIRKRNFEKRGIRTCHINKQSRKKRIAAAVIVVVLVGCMLATTLIASFI